ncbi:MAG: hypothetical protein ACKVJO_06630 [Pseudomonadales bacterium]|jgi:hypothetical protein
MPFSFFNVGFKQSRYFTHAGTHNFYDVDGPVLSQRLNNVDWSSSMITIGITSQY